MTQATPAFAQVTTIDSQMAMSAIMSAGARADRVKAVRRVPSVGVIRLDTRIVPLFDSEVPTEQEFRIMVQKNAGGVAKLQRALAANPATREALARNHVHPSQVAGVQVGSNGALRLYIFSR